MKLVTKICTLIDDYVNENYHPDLILMNQEQYDTLMSELQVQTKYPDNREHFRVPTLQGIPIAIADVDSVRFYEQI